jgi:hypothetical protein
VSTASTATDTLLFASQVAGHAIGVYVTIYCTLEWLAARRERRRREAQDEE